MMAALLLATIAATMMMMAATDTPEFNNSGYYWAPESVIIFAEMVINAFINEVNDFQDESGSNSHDECFYHAKLKLFGDNGGKS